MDSIKDVDRSKIFNTININSAIFTESEVQRVHEIALELERIGKDAIGRNY